MEPLEEELKSNLSSWQLNSKLSNGIINIPDSNELQLVNEVISKDLKVQVVPNCHDLTAPISTPNSYTMSNCDKKMVPHESAIVTDSELIELPEDMANALIRAVGNHEAFENLGSLIDSNDSDYLSNVNNSTYWGESANHVQNQPPNEKVSFNKYYSLIH